MHVPPRIARTAVTIWYLSIQTASDIASSARHVWRDHRADTSLPKLLRRLAKMCRYYLWGAVDPLTFFDIDGDSRGRCRADLDRTARRRWRGLADLRRRRVSMLLRALGDTADQVEATLTQHWQLTGDDHPFDLAEDYLRARLRYRDPSALHYIHVFRWATMVSGVWVATPAPVRAYLRRTLQHEQQLAEAYTRRPRRGPRPAPNPQPVWPRPAPDTSAKLAERKLWSSSAAPSRCDAATRH
jgi:hypothetical protein